MATHSLAHSESDRPEPDALCWWVHPVWIEEDDGTRLVLVVDHPVTGGMVRVGETALVKGREAEAIGRLIERANRMAEGRR